jgi:hypothetical protein
MGGTILDNVTGKTLGYDLEATEQLAGTDQAVLGNWRYLSRFYVRRHLQSVQHRQCNSFQAPKLKHFKTYYADGTPNDRFFLQ